MTIADDAVIIAMKPAAGKITSNKPNLLLRWEKNSLKLNDS